MPTLRPLLDKYVAIDEVINDLPTPPLPLKTPMTLLMLEASFCFDLTISSEQLPF
jgi:hypothetical protein